MARKELADITAVIVPSETPTLVELLSKRRFPDAKRAMVKST